MIINDNNSDSYPIFPWRNFVQKRKDIEKLTLKDTIINLFLHYKFFFNSFLCGFSLCAAIDRERFCED